MKNENPLLLIELDPMLTRSLSNKILKGPYKCSLIIVCLCLKR